MFDYLVVLTSRIYLLIFRIMIKMNTDQISKLSGKIIASVEDFDKFDLIKDYVSWLMQESFDNWIKEWIRLRDEELWLSFKD